MTLSQKTSSGTVSSGSVRLSLVQMRDAGSKDKSIEAATQWIEEAAAGGSQVICLQELFATCYPCQAEDHAMFDLAESIPGPTTEALSQVAKRLEVVIVAPMFERRAPGVYHNTVAVIDADGSIAGVYRKMHIPDDPLYYEKFYFTPGDAARRGEGIGEDRPNGFNVIQTRYAKLGVGICWDQWYPEAARLFALAGAEILLYPTAIGWIDEEKEEFGAGQLDAWMTSIRAHAIANGIFVGAPNRVGSEGSVEFWGNSFIVSPRGEIMQRADDHTDQVLTADCPLYEMDVVRTHWPFLRDRRVDAYGDLTKRWID
ncbi:N-carbamoylputrescine amidase [Neorhodopirellula lusitana]|uniref:N-carbamoylputrescine amidase n=1 Tax=Neorhodopirellula lusitana TaxID=445327 RepID=A0ABY1QJJ7_9BACT|nr:carbon-nitrogen hydrolase [Neorhodopirellula lusitana]SMP73188.1 N-carbamoylputrescine amidase [Neorhodopirellula lusitana]